MTDLLGQLLLNRYQIDRFLGRGGMSDVYRAWDQERLVYLALKMLREDLAQDKVFLRRFEREAGSLLQLQHPNIVRCYGMQRERSLVFLLLDYIDGHVLRQEIFEASGPLPVESVRRVLRGVCAALHYAHTRGYVHCDIKPGNILIGQQRQVFVTDFGISRLAESATMTLLGAGTPAYMAPEQIRGEPPVPGSDIYALGITLYEMLSGGERPFTGEQAPIPGSDAERLRWEHFNLSVPTVRAYNPALPPEIDTVLGKCLAKAPQERYASAADLLNALEPLLPEDRPIAIRPTPVKAVTSSSSRPVARTALRPSDQVRQWAPWVTAALVVLWIGIIMGAWVVNAGKDSTPVAIFTVTAVPQEMVAIETPIFPPINSGGDQATPVNEQKRFCVLRSKSGDTLSAILEDKFEYGRTYSFFLSCQPAGEMMTCQDPREIPPSEYSQMSSGIWLIIPDVETAEECKTRGGALATQ